MTKVRQNKALFLLIVTAFLAVQWTSAHIHLAEHHDHDGSHHQHASQSHLHDLGSHHADAIDVAHVDGHDRVIELDQDCTPQSWNKLDDQSDVPALIEFHSQVSSQYKCLGLSSTSESGSSWLAYSTVRLRAPPHIS